MKVMMVKQPGGVFTPASEIEADRLTRLKNGIAYEIDVKAGEKRNRGFHGKAFAFFSWCFEYWTAENTDAQYQVESAQFDYFRKSLTKLAGYYDFVVDLNGNTMIEVRSLAYDSMSQEEFEQCYSALINAAIANVFNNTTDEAILNRLRSFF